MIFDKPKIASLPQMQNKSLAEATAPSIRSQVGGEPEAEPEARQTTY
jgi:hypothetical protein